MPLELQIQEVMGDFARPNLFEVEIPFIGEGFKFRCKAASIPADTIGPIKVSYQNRKIGIAGDRTYEDWTVTVYVDEAQTTRQLFLNWSDLLHSHARSITGSAPENYKKTAYVRQFARDGETVTSSIQLTGLFPINVSAIALDWETNDAVETFEVTFNVDFWEQLSI